MDIFSASGLFAIVIILTVNWFKKLGMTSKVAPYVSVALGIVIGFIAHFFGGTPGWSTFQALFAGASLGASSAGLYDVLAKSGQIIME